MRKDPSQTQTNRAPRRNSWMPANGYPAVALDPARWSQRARQAAYWRMVEIWNRQRTLN